MTEEEKKQKYKNIKEVKSVQLTGPKCKYEFPFNLGEIDTKREQFTR